MSSQLFYQYPEGADCCWLGSDGMGNVGLFVIGGMGPIPSIALSAIYGDIFAIEGRISELPAISDVQVAKPHPGLDDFSDFDDWIGFARRGFFAYDWSDVHRSRAQYLRGYELVAAPTRPLKIDELGGALHICATLANIPDADFRRDTVLRLSSSAGPVHSERYLG